MSNETPTGPSGTSRARAALARILASFAAGARRLEMWSARGTRPMLIAALAAVVLVIGLVAIVSPMRHVAGWMRGGHEMGRAHRGPESKPIGKPHGSPADRRDDRAEVKPAGKPTGKPELPAPPVSADAPAPPPPPSFGR